MGSPKKGRTRNKHRRSRSGLVITPGTPQPLSLPQSQVMGSPKKGRTRKHAIFALPDTPKQLCLANYDSKERNGVNTPRKTYSTSSGSQLSPGGYKGSPVSSLTRSPGSLRGSSIQIFNDPGGEFWK